MSDIEKNEKNLENETHVAVYNADEVHDDLADTHEGEHGTKRDLVSGKGRPVGRGVCLTSDAPPPTNR